MKREIFEIDVGDPLESERSFCRDSSVWLSKRLSDGKSSEAMTKKLSQVLAADAVRRLSQEEELNLKPERLLRMRWVLTWKYTEGGDRKAKARLVILVCQHPELTNVPTAAPTLAKNVSSFVTSKHAPCTNFVSILVMSPRLLL